MYALLRPLLFALSPSAAHATAELALGPLEVSSAARALARPRLDPKLAVRALGLEFPSPIGLAGGFDKNARRPRALAALGFGFLELGTVTALAQRENPRPNLFRLPLDRALVNRLGFPNDGAEVVAARVRTKRAEIGVPVGISIGKSRAVPLEPLEGAIADYVASLRAVKDACDFVVVNVSSPNTTGLRALQGADIARALLGELAREAGARPLLLKIAPDLDDDELSTLLSVVRDVKLAGVIATNTTTHREGLVTDAKTVEAIGAGGLSGPPLRARALEVVRKAHAHLGAGFTIIGVGGISSGEDVVAFLRAGADLVQIYTAFVYRGPRAPALLAEEMLALR